jgi:hypothetical protein
MRMSFRHPFDEFAPFFLDARPRPRNNGQRPAFVRERDHFNLFWSYDQTCACCASMFFSEDPFGLRSVRSADRLGNRGEKHERFGRLDGGGWRVWRQRFTAYSVHYHAFDPLRVPAPTFTRRQASTIPATWCTWRLKSACGRSGPTARATERSISRGWSWARRSTATANSSHAAATAVTRGCGSAR